MSISSVNSVVLLQVELQLGAMPSSQPLAVTHLFAPAPKRKSNSANQQSR